MDITCGACGKQHKSNAKLEESLAKLAPGKKIRLKCSQCQEPILLDKGMLDGHRAKVEALSTRVKPPEPPDTSWLYEGEFVDDEMVADIPQAMVLMPEGQAMDEVLRALAGLGYQAITVENTKQALEKMQFVNYSNIVLHSRFEGGGLEGNRFHTYIQNMEMARRRFIFYVLIGPEFKTFYNLEALSNSANLVVDEQDSAKFDIILRKAIPEYEELFGAYMTELRVQGR
jgi:hypothetical protein